VAASARQRRGAKGHGRSGIDLGRGPSQGWKEKKVARGKMGGVALGFREETECVFGKGSSGLKKRKVGEEMGAWGSGSGGGYVQAEGGGHGNDGWLCSARQEEVTA
jgi:hypothetical protein